MSSLLFYCLLDMDVSVSASSEVLVRVVFAPDYRKGTPYQALLSRELGQLGVSVEYLSQYRRGLPLTRGLRELRADILHIHWPEAYFAGSVRQRCVRKIRFPVDVMLAARNRCLFWTAHNLLPHNRASELGVRWAIQKFARDCSGIFVHSAFAKEQVVGTFRVSDEKCWVVPCGDHAATWPPPLDHKEARLRVGLRAEQPICLIFGTISPYKGVDEVVRYWAAHRPEAELVVVGTVLHEKFASTLLEIARNAQNVQLHFLDHWLTDAELHRWLSAVDCTIFNYRQVFTSGAAALARSMGVPILIPSRLRSVDLHEPHPSVFRFESLDTDFAENLRAALQTRPNYDAAADWRRDTSWLTVASITKNVYQSAV